MSAERKPLTSEEADRIVMAIGYFVGQHIVLTDCPTPGQTRILKKADVAHIDFSLPYEEIDYTAARDLLQKAQDPAMN